jgi:hypothetical protein
VDRFGIFIVGRAVDKDLERLRDGNNAVLAVVVVPFEGNNVSSLG